MRFLITALVFLASIALAQEETNAPPNYAVQFYGDNVTGHPYYWPKVISSIGTNEVAPDGWFFFTEAQLADLKATNSAEFAEGNSNRAYTAKVKFDANIARLLVLYDQIPAARTILANDLITITNIEQSLASGTNSLAQVVTRIRQINGNCANHIRIEQGILEILQRLGPVLRQIYRPEEDDTD